MIEAVRLAQQQVKPKGKASAPRVRVKRDDAKPSLHSHEADMQPVGENGVSSSGNHEKSDHEHAPHDAELGDTGAVKKRRRRRKPVNREAGQSLPPDAA